MELLQPGARDVFDPEIPGTRFSLVDSATGLPVPRPLHAGLPCPG